MANESIRAAFERMWQHTVAKIENEVAGLDNGANVLVVTTEWDEENECYKASHTPKQIYDYTQSGGVAVLKMDGNVFYNLYHTDGEYVSFFYVDNALMFFLCEIDNICECHISESQIASLDTI